MNQINNFDNYISNKSNSILRFGEYRKGSNEYGNFIQDLMMNLRSIKKNDEDNLIIKSKDVNFDLNILYKLKNDDNRRRLISFDFKFIDNNGNEIEKPNENCDIMFYNLNKKNDRPWENKSYD